MQDSHVYIADPKRAGRARTLIRRVPGLEVNFIDTANNLFERADDAARWSL
jgi:hypothetical protein